LIRFALVVGALAVLCAGCGHGFKLARAAWLVF
jgi:hypothetical protein